MENNYVISVETCTFEQYMDEADMDRIEVVEMFGRDVIAFVEVKIYNYKGYFRRVCKGIYTDDMLEHMQAVQSATLELLHDYFTYGKH